MIKTINLEKINWKSASPPHPPRHPPFKKTHKKPYGVFEKQSSSFPAILEKATINKNNISLLCDSDHVVVINNNYTALSRFFPERKFATNPQSEEKY